MKAKYISQTDYEKEYIRILKQARKLIASGQQEFICHAIREVYSDSAHALRTWIREMLVNHGTLESWICMRIGNFPHNSTKMRLTRLAWLDAMIAYLEKGGKIK